jgi:hypothetical protein
MRGTVAKRIRKKAYGSEYAPRFREYRMLDRFDHIKGKLQRMWGTVEADPRRRAYQEAKRAYKRGEVRVA